MSIDNSDLQKIKGFFKRPKRNASGGIYRGRLSCPSVQWTGVAPDTFATFTVTADEIAGAAESRLLWTDQDVQRGVKPSLTETPPRELCLCDGYPDREKYIFDTEKADAIVEKLLAGERSYLNPLVWNLRPGQFEAYWNKDDAELYVYNGKIYLPDSHHRQQAILKAVRTWRDAPREYPRFAGDREFKIELYFLTKEDEGNYFYEKNQLPKPTSKSKAYDLTTVDDLSVLAKTVIEKSEALKNNVNRVTDRLTAQNPQVMTLSTLREMMKALATADELDRSELEGTAIVAASFYDLLSTVRPELGVLPVAERRRIRNELLVDAAVMMHGYAALMRDFQTDIPRTGLTNAQSEWRTKLQRLNKNVTYSQGQWSGDLFDKKNPVWRHVGVVKPGTTGGHLTVMNTGAARLASGRVLRALIAAKPSPTDLSFLMVR